MALKSTINLRTPVVHNNGHVHLVRELQLRNTTVFCTSGPPPSLHNRDIGHLVEKLHDNGSVNNLAQELDEPKRRPAQQGHRPPRTATEGQQRARQQPCPRTARLPQRATVSCCLLLFILFCFVLFCSVLSAVVVVAMLLSCCCHADVMLLSCCCHAVVMLLSCCCGVVVVLLACCCRIIVVLLSRCHSVVFVTLLLSWCCHVVRDVLRSVCLCHEKP